MFFTILLWLKVPIFRYSIAAIGVCAFILLAIMLAALFRNKEKQFTQFNYGMGIVIIALLFINNFPLIKQGITEQYIYPKYKFISHSTNYDTVKVNNFGLNVPKNTSVNPFILCYDMPLPCVHVVVEAHPNVFQKTDNMGDGFILRK